MHELTADRHSTDSNPIEEYEGGTLISQVTATAQLKVDGLMDRGAAAAADGSLVDVLTEQWNDHYSAVLACAELEVDLEFVATINPDYEHVADFEFVAARVVGPMRR